MISHRWYAWIQRPFDPATIQAEVQRAESQYWFWFILNIGIIASGLVFYYITLRTDAALAGLGLIVMLVGLINSVLVKIWAHVMLSMFRLAVWLGRR